MYLFSQQGLKNLKIWWFFMVFSPPFACSLQNHQLVTSFSAVTILPTVISLLSATSSCPSRKSHICLMRGAEATTCLFLASNGTPSIPTVVRSQPRFYFRCSLPRLTGEARDCVIHAPKPQACCQNIPYLWNELKLPS